MTINYDAPTPETDAFMSKIDDSEIDLGQVRAKLQELECERNALNAQSESAREIVSSMSPCACTDSAFIYGCNHLVRRLRELLTA